MQHAADAHTSQAQELRSEPLVHCNTPALQHAAIRCNTRTFKALGLRNGADLVNCAPSAGSACDLARDSAKKYKCVAVCCNVVWRVAVRCRER